jgi:hypothetical protein
MRGVKPVASRRLSANASVSVCDLSWAQARLDASGGMSGLG